MYCERQAVQNTWTCWKCVTRAFLWSRFVSHLDPSPRQRASLAEAIHLMRVRATTPEKRGSRRLLSICRRHVSESANDVMGVRDPSASIYDNSALYIRAVYAFSVQIAAFRGSVSPLRLPATCHLEHSIWTELPPVWDLSEAAEWIPAHVDRAPSTGDVAQPPRSVSARS